ADKKPSANWSFAYSPHFRLYYQGREADADATLEWLEQLRSAFASLNPPSAARAPARVFAFKDRDAYARYTLGPAADAFYVGTDTRDYIVLARLGRSEFAVAAHEYAHLMMRGAAAQCPLWLSEGLAELLSTVRVSGSSVEIGGEIPAHVQTLEREDWLALEDVFAASHERVRSDREFARRFYAQSWALTAMLLSSAEYARCSGAFVANLSTPTSSETAFAQSCGKNVRQIEQDLRGFHARNPRMALPRAAVAEIPIQHVAISEFEWRLALADLQLASGELGNAKEAYSELVRDFPATAAAHEGLGEIAWRKKDYAKAREEWQRAIDLGLNDADLCLRLASLSALTAMPPETEELALKRALKLRPDFDEAHYRLALIESNSGDFASAVEDLRAIRYVTAARRFAYWAALSYALDELGAHDEAISAAKEAASAAANNEERAHAAQLVYIAGTELRVRFLSNADGSTRLATVRIPRGVPPPNPFILPDDKVETVHGRLTSVRCANGQASAFVVRSAERDIVLTVERPDRIQVEHGPETFSCGDQPTAPDVTAEYASTPRPQEGKLRGLYFRDR
ncbi:MAG: tetratricopeptide repeat protein, partial [Acidobacteriaceae bacterium]|nr:tetratricopeptide repeat protein [Acidobacteriaceae bacterium]